MNLPVFSVEITKKRFAIGKGCVEEHLLEATNKLFYHQGSVAKLLQNLANHVDSVEDSFIGSLKAFEFEKDRLSQMLGDRSSHAFKPEHEATSAWGALAFVSNTDRSQKCDDLEARFKSLEKDVTKKLETRTHELVDTKIRKVAAEVDTQFRHLEGSVNQI